MGFAVPAGTPEPVVGRLNAELNRIGQLPAVREKMLAQGIEMLPPESPAQAQKLVRDDLTLWLASIKAPGPSPDQYSLPSPSAAWGGVREADGGVMSISTVAHDPSGPAGH